MFAPFVYIIIPNTNGHLHTIECLESVFKQKYKNYKVIVVDNSNDESSYRQIIQWCENSAYDVPTNFPEYVYPLTPKPIRYTFYHEDDALNAEGVTADEKLIIIKANHNNGFSAANNVGIKYVLKKNDFDWIWLLNNDTVIPPDCLENFALKQPVSDRVGMIATKLFYYNSPQYLQAIGGKYNKWLSTTSHVGENEKDESQYDNITWSDKADYVIGASMFVSKAFLYDVGLMCEDYFFYFEEMDWAIRGKRKGWTIDYAPACKVYHKDGGTVPSQSKAKSLLSDVSAVRNRLLFARKFYPWHAPVAYLGLIAVVGLRIKRKQYGRLVHILQAVLTNKSPKEYIGIKE